MNLPEFKIYSSTKSDKWLFNELAKFNSGVYNNSIYAPFVRPMANIIKNHLRDRGFTL